MMASACLVAWPPLQYMYYDGQRAKIEFVASLRAETFAAPTTTPLYLRL